jgi:chromatin segregation and condensation protein Rec8/ScpA/Scc1 (kleisin family)
VLYGREEEKRYELERIEIDEGELPTLVPRTPMARHKKVTLQELMNALNKAIDTENRRIKREIKGKQAEKSALAVLPKSTFVPLKTRVRGIFGIVKKHIDEGNGSMKFSHLASDKEEKLAAFVPILHLSDSGKIYLRQSVHFDEIHMTLKIHDDEVRELEEELGRHEGDELEN